MTMIVLCLNQGESSLQVVTDEERIGLFKLYETFADSNSTNKHKAYRSSTQREAEFAWKDQLTRNGLLLCLEALRGSNSLFMNFIHVNKLPLLPLDLSNTAIVDVT